MKIKFLLIGTSLSLIPNLLYAQCSPAQSCAELGYNETANKGGCLKCPFGNGWYCPQKACDSSYQYTCVEANEQLGTDKCGGKYKACTCASGYEWKDGKCQTKGAVLGQCTGYAKNCKIGQILNSDGTCTTNKETEKTPIGVIVYIGSNNCGQALALQNLGNRKWGIYATDIPELPNYMDTPSAEQDFDSCDNTQKIIKFGNISTYPAAWTAVNYAPNSAPTTKGKWCLPAAGIAKAMMNNYDKINSGLSKAEGELLPSSPAHSHWIWSSSEHSNFYAWAFCIDSSYRLSASTKNNTASNRVVRPVIKF